MKASDFLNLVGEARKEATAYYATKKHYPLEARDHLIRAKALEKQIDAVVKEGRLEPDDEPATAVVLSEAEYQQRMELSERRFPDEPDAADL